MRNLPYPPVTLCNKLQQINLVTQGTAKAMLSKLGLAVHIANNGQEAVDFVHSNHCDLILMDCQMPLMDGFLSKPYSLDQLQQIMLHWLPKEKIILLTTSAPATMATSSETSNGPVLNPKQLDQIRSLNASGGKELVQKILHAFLESADENINQLKEAILKGDTESLQRSAHMLKSSSANIGAESLAEIFKQLEAAGQSGELNAAKILQNKMQQLYQRIILEIREILNKL